MAKYFEEFAVGEELLTPGRTITETDMASSAITGRRMAPSDSVPAKRRNMGRVRQSSSAVMEVKSASNAVMIEQHRREE